MPTLQDGTTSVGGRGPLPARVAAAVEATRSRWARLRLASSSGGAASSNKKTIDQTDETTVQKKMETGEFQHHSKKTSQFYLGNTNVLVEKFGSGKRFTA